MFERRCVNCDESVFGKSVAAGTLEHVPCGMPEPRQFGLRWIKVDDVQCVERCKRLSD